MNVDTMIQNPLYPTQGNDPLITPAKLLECAHSMAAKAAKREAGHTSPSEIQNDTDVGETASHARCKYDLISEWASSMSEHDSSALWGAFYWPDIPFCDL
ncbi:hypothetical protein [Halomonas sp. 3A7M]|uniref:hypothetical protein n=1 Tax=Halomonas sp. 3A7M TaxID=2742616 RepID=UPI0018674563|nr:hypothetical protein [Halomonas sp. 3A7M]